MVERKLPRDRGEPQHSGDMRLPDAPWAELVSALGYGVGFVIVIMGNLKLFTENTITAVLPLATHPTLRNLGRLARLWVIMFCANMAKTLLVAILLAQAVIASTEQLQSAIAISSPSCRMMR